jgi:hypothetical protein
MLPPSIVKKGVPLAVQVTIDNYLVRIFRRRKVLLYVGPDQMMPLTSVLASIVGLFLIFWNRLRIIFQKIFLKPKPALTDNVKS